MPVGVSPLEYYVQHVDDGAFDWDPQPMQTIDLPNATACVQCAVPRHAPQTPPEHKIK